MVKDAYVFYCSKCKTDHAGECAKTSSFDGIYRYRGIQEQAGKWLIDCPKISLPGAPYYAGPGIMSYLPGQNPPAYVPPVAPPSARTWFNGTVTAIDKASGYVTIKLDDISNAQQLSLNQIVEIDTET